MAKKKKQECPSIPGWLVSFGDLMSLLLTFFILLFSMSTVSLEKFYQSIRGITEAFGSRRVDIKKQEGPLIPSKVELQNKNAYPKLKKKKRILKEVNEVVSMLHKMGVEAEVVEHGNKIILRVFSDSFFLPGSAEPTPKVIPILQKFCQKFKNSGFKIDIVGYTDDTPINSPLFKDNWELSTYRAINVLKLFLKCGYDKRFLSAEGRGPYDPIVPNNTPANRAKNRRVEFAIDLSNI